MKGKTVILGVTGGIAAYKSVETVRLLVKQGFSVHVIMTKAGSYFINPLTFKTVTGNPVFSEMFERTDSQDVLHIRLAKMADILVITPATANCLGKVSSGIADDLLTTVIMASKAPVLFVPSMNDAMYSNPIVANNIKKLRELGYNVMEPCFGHLACGDMGKGRSPEPKDIVCKIKDILFEKLSLKGITILVTAGPTQEPLDPVRYITNRSSGKMGYELADAARKRGADVILVSGPSTLPSPSGVNLIRVRTTQEMYQAVMDNLKDTDVIIGAAAPCDWRPQYISPEKLKKDVKLEHIPVVKCNDIMFEVGKLKGNRISIGFAAETKDLIENAKKKLIYKNFDFIVANDISRHDSGFESDFNEVKIIHSKGDIEALPLMTKQEVSMKILDRIEALL